MDGSLSTAKVLSRFDYFIYFLTGIYITVECREGGFTLMYVLSPLNVGN
jgi:hypothetical protein